MFSSALRLTDLNDFVAPAQECIKPSAPAAVSLSLADCLACSGCVTSAETVLITAQSLEEFERVLATRETTGTTIVVSCSPQAVASLAAAYGESSLPSTLARLTAALRRFGIAAVVDTCAAQDMALQACLLDFVARMRQRQQTTTTATGTGTGKVLPMLTSECPGWVCYAEKTHGDAVLPLMSTTRSPQQILGAQLKDSVRAALGRATAPVYHLAIMPCYDKKLEASREEFSRGSERDVDCVLSSLEVTQFLEKHGVVWEEISIVNSINSINSSGGIPIPSSIAESRMSGYAGSGSGGYLEYVARGAVKILFNVDVPFDTALPVKQLKNSDFAEVTIRDGAGTPILRLAYCYGFRNIQTLIRQIKLGKCQYDFIEVMACPGGCLNGGGQVRPRQGESAKDLLDRLDVLFRTARDTRPPALPPFSIDDRFTSLTTTHFVNRKQIVSASSLTNW